MVRKPFLLNGHLSKARDEPCEYMAIESSGRVRSKRPWNAWCAHRTVIIINTHKMSTPEIIELFVLGLGAISFIRLAFKLAFGL